MKIYFTLTINRDEFYLADPPWTGLFCLCQSSTSYMYGMFYISRYLVEVFPTTVKETRGSKII